MRVLLSTYGSRGDVEPLAALAVQLQALGVETVVSAPPDQEFTDLLTRAGVPLTPAFMPIRQWVSERAKPASTADFHKLASDMMAAQFTAISAAAEGCDALVATGLFPSVGAARSVAELRGLSYHHVTFCPFFLPSHHHRPFFYPGHPLPSGVTDNRALWDFNARTVNALFGEALATHRVSVGLRPVDSTRDLVLAEHPLLASDPVLWPWQPTDLCDAVQTGAWILPDERPLSAELMAFLNEGEPPIYVGFGSMSLPSVRHTAHMAIDVIRAQGRRVVMLSGWAGLAPGEDRNDCFITGDVNQQALFPRMAAVVHHGGAGTTIAATRAGAPQVIVPQVVDQPCWAARVAELGIGAAHEGSTPSFESLSAALAIALAPETGARAAAVARMVRTNGAEVAARLLIDAIGR
ncbi:Glycosyltransferase GtfE [Bosea sp. 62]|uniref:glycosyltransferase n=1 Tax=unclassified Bosea (in: a-proteobacteria) TaxID=2653178 RepID=UPI00125109BA|nr:MULTISPECIES: glycosyltransferase [unclassified Bosea (in: a-proteobacteria)]CAD5264695.1 Glycosyltransferase GtfE [Bosea sp. 46]CAD5267051.1 Glycosyltransferase GtfE [Bosea sp. 21B]CAD5272207.1 Glycosyltransferase GtfE [Bosea sp. 7B]VVT55974.1 Glycosyltransferase GtfE [Bosea sp. EC-HK365B]VXB83400.1 Glycosyltransferase GtfE [Bosea sp. 29B]